MPDSSTFSTLVIFFLFYLLTLWLVSRGVVHQMREVLDRTSMILRYLGTEQADGNDTTEAHSTGDMKSEESVPDEHTPPKVQINLMKNRIGGIKPATGQDTTVKPDGGSNVTTPTEEPKESHLLSFKRGLLFLHQKKYKLAIAQFTRTIEIKPDFPLVYEYRGEAYFWIGEKDKAKADLKKAKELKGL